MKDRIQVDGMWYIRETSIPEIEINPNEVTNTLGCVWESKNWVFIATAILQDEAEDLLDIYTGINVDITDKRNSDRDLWIEHDCDNTTWFIGVLEGNPESMPDAEEMFDEQGIAEFRGFIKYLIQKGWVVKE